MQLAVVLLVMPWLVLASRSPHYVWLRATGASLGLVAGLGWIAQRAIIECL
jgi:cytosine/uracil/thiamine/allantoin permease